MLFVSQQSEQCVFHTWLRLRIFVFEGDFKMSFAQNLKAARKNLKLTQQNVADTIGICRPAVAHYEDGKALSHAKNINKLCEILNLTYDELFKA